MSGPGFLLIIVAFAFLYFVIVRPHDPGRTSSIRTARS